MLTTKLIQVNRYYYRCEVTKWLYFIVSKNSKIIKFKCASLAYNKSICNKYVKDVVKLV